MSTCKACVWPRETHVCPVPRPWAGKRLRLPKPAFQTTETTASVSLLVNLHGKILTSCRRARESARRDSTPATSPQSQPYPNPGFLGSSSHSTIFNKVSSFALRSSDSHLHDTLQSSSHRHMPKDTAVVERAIDTLRQFSPTEIAHLKSLIFVWLDQGTSLPLAEPLIVPFAEVVVQAANAAPSPAANDWVSEHANSLMENAGRPIILHSNTSVADFFTQLLGEHLRWEVLGIFFTAASRAAIDTPSFPALYTKSGQQWDLIRSLTYIGDCCLEACLAADCLTDLQLVLQYENCIVHSQVDGDQS